MSELRRVKSLTLKESVKFRRHGHNTSNYFAEVDEHSKRQVFELSADDTRRIVIIKDLQSGDVSEVAYEGCRQWNPYQPSEEIPGQPKAKPSSKGGRAA